MKKIMALVFAVAVVLSLGAVAADTYKLTGSRLADTTIWDADWAAGYLQGYDATTKELTMNSETGGCVNVLLDTEGIHNKVVEFEAKIGDGNSFSMQLRSTKKNIVNNDGNSDYGFFVQGGKAFIRKWLDGVQAYQWDGADGSDFAFDKRTYYNIKLAAIDQDDGSVKLSMWIDDELAIEAIDSDNPFKDPGYLVFWCQGRVMLRDFGELPAGEHTPAAPEETAPATAPATTPAETTPATAPATTPAETAPATAPATTPAETAPATQPAETAPTTTPVTGGISLIAVAGLVLPYLL